MADEQVRPFSNDSHALCLCGCGSLAPIATSTCSKRGYVKGKPRRFVSGHNMSVKKDIGPRPIQKICVKCGIEKPVSEFGKKSDYAHGLDARCYQCVRLKAAEFRKTHRAQVSKWEKDYWKRKGKESQREKWKAYSPVYRTRRHELYVKNKEEIVHKSRQKRYGLSRSEYSAMMQKQQGTCAICERCFDNLKVYIDHDHATNRVRGLLCLQCNASLGNMRDDIRLLRRAVEYLELYREVAVVIP